MLACTLSKSLYSRSMEDQILIADDHPLFREALKGILQPVLANCQFNEAVNYDEAKSIMSSTGLKLAFIDLNMPGSSGLVELALLKKLSPQTPMIIVSAHDANDVIRTCLDYGASGYIIKSASSEEIRNAVEVVLAGDVYTPPSLSSNESANDDDGAKLQSLTPSQLKVFIEIGKGKLNKQIAFDLDVSEATVKAHITSIFKKLGINNRTQAVIYAKRYEAEIPEIK